MAGRPIPTTACLKAYHYYTLGLQKREIARALKTNQWQVARWIRYVQNGRVKPKDEELTISEKESILEAGH